jgi:hypothetical protein
MKARYIKDVKGRCPMVKSIEEKPLAVFKISIISLSKDSTLGRMKPSFTLLDLEDNMRIGLPLI